MYLYFLIYAVAAGLAYMLRSRGDSRVVAYLFAAFLVFFAGSRVDVGCDWDSYVNRFLYGYPDVGWLAYFRQGEGAFTSLNVIVRNMGYEFSVVVFLCAVIYTFGLVRFSALAQRPLAFLALSFPILVLQLGMSGLRQAMAAAFLMLALRSFVEKRRLWMVAWIVVASQFHTSAIMFLPVVFLIGRKVSAKRMALSVLLIGPLVALLLENRLEVYNTRYIDEAYGEMSSSGAWYRYVLTLLPFLFFVAKRKLVETRYPKLFELLRLFAYIAFALAGVGAFSSVALHRLTFYVMPVSILAFLCVSESIFDRGSRRVGMAVPFMVYGLYLVSWFSLSGHAADCYVPYQSWLL
jgi:hypothetical protein